MPARLNQRANKEKDQLLMMSGGWVPAPAVQLKLRPKSIPHVLSLIKYNSRSNCCDSFTALGTNFFLPVKKKQNKPACALSPSHPFVSASERAGEKIACKKCVVPLGELHFDVPSREVRWCS